MLRGIGATQRLCANAMAYASNEKPQDFVIASGQKNSVREFIELSAKELAGIRKREEKPLSGKKVV